MNKLEIITPRGANIGRNILTTLTAIGIYGAVDIKTIHTERDVTSKTNVTTLGYAYNGNS